MARGLPAVVLVLVVLLAGSPQPASATSQALEPVRSDPAWYGGAPPKISAIGVTGELRDPKTDRYFFRAKATVDRLGADRNGKIVLLRAKNWGEAFDKLDRLAASKLGVTRGFTRDSIVKTFGYTAAELRRPFPDLTAAVAYDVFVSRQGENPRHNGPAAKRTLGDRSFVEPLSIGIPAGTHEVGVIGCFWPDESHPMAKPFAWFVRGAVGGNAVNKVRTAIVAAAAGGPAGALASLVAQGLAAQLGKSFVITTVTCATSTSKLTYKTTTPNVVGLDGDDARRELRSRWLKAEVDVDIVRRASCDGFKSSVVRQSPKAGTKAARDTQVFIATRHCVEKAPPPAPPAPPACDPKNPWHGTWTRVEHAGTMTVTQKGGKIERFAYSWYGRTGQFDELRQSDRTLKGRDPGWSTFTITVTQDAKAFHGTFSWIGKPGGGQFNGTRKSCTI
jgi:hypothetical protein